MNIIKALEHISRDRNWPFLASDWRARCGSIRISTDHGRFGYPRAERTARWLGRSADVKLHALRYGPPRRQQKDLDDIIELIASNRLGDKLRELCERFGTQELYERIRAALGDKSS